MRLVTEGNVKCAEFEEFTAYHTWFGDRDFYWYVMASGKKSEVFRTKGMMLKFVSKENELSKDRAAFFSVFARLNFKHNRIRYNAVD